MLGEVHRLPRREGAPLATTGAPLATRRELPQRGAPPAASGHIAGRAWGSGSLHGSVARGVEKDSWTGPTCQYGGGKRQELTDVDGSGTQVKETSMKGIEELFEI